MTIENGSLLPEDVIIEILSWLPGKTLLQVTCVCKSWRAIITCSKFISKHLNNYYNNTNNGCLLARYFVSPIDQPHSFELFTDETLTDLSHQTLEVPIQASRICGPSNGIFYLHSIGTKDCALWNPTTREVKILPAKITKPNLEPNISFENGVDACGFGFDPLTNDYKVVVLQELWDEVRIVSYDRQPVLVYTLATDSWRYWGDLTREYYWKSSKCYTCLNGVFYWLVCYYDGENGVLNHSILSFSIGNEVFEEIQVPDYSDEPGMETLALYHDSIALLILHDIDEKLLDIWVIDHDGCWTKKWTIGPLLGGWKPIGCWKNGKVLELDTNLFLCDPSNQEIRDLQFQGTLYCLEILIYKESLVHIENRND